MAKSPDYRRQLEKRRKRADLEDKAVFAVGVGCVSLLVLIKLAFLALIAWGIFELVNWVISK